jgi:dipeptidyl aminopeptidase/acylaminoacyl peptidase
MIRALTAAALAVVFSGAADIHPFGIDDAAALRSARPIAISPDGASVLYRVDSGGARGPTNHEWRVIGFDGAGGRKLDLPERFTPFGFTRDGGSLYGAFEVNRLRQLAVFSLSALNTGQTPSLAVFLPSGIHSAVISPDGSKYAILASPRPPDALADVHEVIEPDQTSLYVVNTDGTGGGWWCPALKTIADSGLAGTAIAWAADGASIAVLSQTPKIGFHEVRSYIDICRGGGIQHVAEIPNAASGIAWADAGRQLVFLSTMTAVLTPDHVWTVPAAGGMPVDRTPKLEASATSMAADPRGNAWVLVERGVQREVNAFRDGQLTPAFRWSDGTVDLPVFPELAASPARLAFQVADPHHADNVAVADNGTLRKITTEGDDQLAKVDLGPVRVVKWTSKDGVALEGIATFPAGYEEGKRYPFVVLPHGGPEASDALRLGFFSRMIAGLGYVVLQPEYRGSTGYGSDFLQAIYQHFGDRAYRDVESATDFAIAQGWADENRLAMFGWSAGGFMTSWTVTQTGRYRAAIEGAGITDWGSFIYTSDVPQIDYDARWPEKDPAAFAQFSAMSYVDRVTTPLLVLHGLSDQRVPAYQGREFFEALAAHGKTTRMVAYPGSGHFPSRWEQIRDVFREVAEWLKKYNP